MSFETQNDPVLILATPHYLCFGIHGATSPTYESRGWTRAYSSDLTPWPAWPSEYIRCMWDGNGFLLPDQCQRRPPTPRNINAKRLPWLRAPEPKGVKILGGALLSDVAVQFASMGVAFYVPMTRLSRKRWAWLDRVRAACLKAGSIVDDDR